MPDEEKYERGNGSWAEILKGRSPEGRAVVLLPNQAEQTCMEAQREVTRAIEDRRDSTAEFAAFEAASAEVDRMREEVYRMVRQ